MPAGRDTRGAWSGTGSGRPWGRHPDDSRREEAAEVGPSVHEPLDTRARRLHGVSSHCLPLLQLLRLLDSQEEQERWLLENREFFREKIKRGAAQLDRGEGIPGDQFAQYLEERKRNAK